MLFVLLDSFTFLCKNVSQRRGYHPCQGNYHVFPLLCLMFIYTEVFQLTVFLLLHQVRFSSKSSCLFHFFELWNVFCETLI